MGFKMKGFSAFTKVSENGNDDDFKIVGKDGRVYDKYRNVIKSDEGGKTGLTPTYGDGQGVEHYTSEGDVYTKGAQASEYGTWSKTETPGPIVGKPISGGDHSLMIGPELPPEMKQELKDNFREGEAELLKAYENDEITWDEYDEQKEKLFAPIEEFRKYEKIHADPEYKKNQEAILKQLNEQTSD